MTEMPSTAARISGRVNSIHTVRGVAAALVVLAHVIEHGPGKAENPINLTGRFGVEIFFVISGFVIMHVAGDRPFDGWRFFARRLWRVAPLYWVLTLLVAALAIVAPEIFHTTAFNTYYFVTSMFFIPAPGPGTTGWRPLFKLGWTLNYEMFFYLAMALLFWCRTMVSRAQILTALLGVLVLCSFFIPPRASIFAFYANLNLIPFIVGGWMAVLWSQGKLQGLSTPVIAAAIVGAVVMTGWFYQIDYPRTKDLDGHIIMSAAAILIVLSMLMLEYRLAWPAFTAWFGDISYSLYLTHMFVVGVGWAIINKTPALEPTIPRVLALIVTAAASFVLATLTFRYVEKPLLKLANVDRAALGRLARGAAG